MPAHNSIAVLEDLSQVYLRFQPLRGRPGGRFRLTTPGQMNERYLTIGGLHDDLVLRARGR